MPQSKTLLPIALALVIGVILGVFADRYIYSNNTSSNSLAQFVLKSPTTPWVADVQGVIKEMGDNSISLQLRTKEGTSKEVYLLNLVPRDRLVVDKVEKGSDTDLTTSKINYQDLKAGDEVVATVSSDGQKETLVVSKITLISGVTSSQ